MSKIRGILNEQQFKQHEHDIKQRSITPDTFKSRIILEKPEDWTRAEIITLNILKPQPPENVIYLDKYQHKESSVLHFGINTYQDTLAKEIEVYNNQAIKLQPLSSKHSKKTDQLKVYAQKIKISSVEKLIIETAIDYLNQTDTPTVLIDVLIRDNEGKITKDKDKTHTVVLYTQNNGYFVTDAEFFVIDPSNTTFSSFLANSTNKIETGYGIKKIYQPPATDQVGPNSDQWRDCCDLAVKIAFGFNQEKPTLEFDSEANFAKSLAQTYTIKSLTNSQTINSSLRDELIEYPVRIRQASDNDLIKTSNNKFDLIDKTIKDMSKFKSIHQPTSDKYEKVLNNLEERLSVDYKPSNYHVALQDYNILLKTIHTSFEECITEYTTILSGNINNEINEI